MAASEVSYETKPNDVLDAIIQKHYGATSQELFELVYSANYGLAKHGTLLPAGITIKLPKWGGGQNQTATRIWD